jgi:hypothetical protein
MILVLTWKLIIFPFILKDTFDGYSNLFWQLFVSGLETYLTMLSWVLGYLLGNLAYF